MSTSKPQDAANVVPAGPHDKVAMLSLRADGTPDQYAPEIVGDVEFAKAATRKQFAQQAVSAVDEAKRAELGLAGGGSSEAVGQDPAIEALKDEHDKAAASAEKRADAVVESLSK